jgi:hypothetical protein
MGRTLEGIGGNAASARSETGSAQKTQDRDLGKAAKSSDFLLFRRISDTRVTAL